MRVRFLDDYDGSVVVADVISIVFLTDSGFDKLEKVDGKPVISNQIKGNISLRLANGDVWTMDDDKPYFEYERISDALFRQGTYDFVTGCHYRFCLDNDMEEEED